MKKIKIVLKQFYSKHKYSIMFIYLFIPIMVIHIYVAYLLKMF